ARPGEAARGGQPRRARAMRAIPVPSRSIRASAQGSTSDPVLASGPRELSAGGAEEVGELAESESAVGASPAPSAAGAPSPAVARPRVGLDIARGILGVSRLLTVAALLTVSGFLYVARCLLVVSAVGLLVVAGLRGHEHRDGVRGDGRRAGRRVPGRLLDHV